MKKENMNTTVEIYICNYDRGQDEESCFSRGAKELTDELKKWAKEESQKGIKVVRGGCLGKCSQGIAMSCYPEKKFILEAKKEDTEEIKKGLKEALESARN
jgi:NADH:ubiquinone oxidoreductase subunit E